MRSTPEWRSFWANQRLTSHKIRLASSVVRGWRKAVLQLNTVSAAHVHVRSVLSCMIYAVRPVHRTPLQYKYQNRPHFPQFYHNNPAIFDKIRNIARNLWHFTSQLFPRYFRNVSASFWRDRLYLATQNMHRCMRITQTSRARLVITFLQTDSL